MAEDLHRNTTVGDYIYIFLYKNPREKIPNGLVIIIIVILCSNWLIGIPTNVLTMFSLVYQKRLKIMRNTFIILNFVTDLGICAIYSTLAFIPLTAGRIPVPTCAFAAGLHAFCTQTKLMCLCVVSIMQIVRLVYKNKQYDGIFNVCGTWGSVATIIAPGILTIMLHYAGVFTVELTWQPTTVACTRDGPDLLHRYYPSFGKHSRHEHPSEHTVAKLELAFFIIQCLILVGSFIYLSVASFNYKYSEKNKVADSNTNTVDKADSNKKTVNNNNNSQADVGSKTTANSGQSSLFPEDQPEQDMFYTIALEICRWIPLIILSLFDRYGTPQSVSTKALVFYSTLLSSSLTPIIQARNNPEVRKTYKIVQTLLLRCQLDESPYYVMAPAEKPGGAADETPFKQKVSGTLDSDKSLVRSLKIAATRSYLAEVEKQISAGAMQKAGSNKLAASREGTLASRGKSIEQQRTELASTRVAQSTALSNFKRKGGGKHHKGKPRQSGVPQDQRRKSREISQFMQNMDTEIETVTKSLSQMMQKKPQIF